MYSNTLRKYLGTLLGGTLSFFAYHTYYAYNSPSQLELALKELNIKSRQEQESVISILYCAGRLNPKTVWQDINNINLGGSHTKKIFLENSYPVLYEANTDQKEFDKFDPKIIQQNLFGKSKPYLWQLNSSANNITKEKALEWFIYSSQGLFARKKGEERHDIKHENDIEYYKTQYLKSAETLGFISEKAPNYANYDEAWLLGASRLGMLARAKYAKDVLKDKDVKIIRILAGNRELYAELDGISLKYKEAIGKVSNNTKIADVRVDNGRISEINNEKLQTLEEGKQYLIRLANQFNINFNKDEPIISYSKENCPKGKEPNRHYLNYQNPADKLTETQAAKEIAESIFGADYIIEIVDTISTTGTRPDTRDTVKDATKILANELKHKNCYHKEYKIAVISNNPYTNRQSLIVEQELKKTFSNKDYKDFIVKTDTIGFGFKENITTLKSEIAATYFEAAKNWAENNNFSQEAFKKLSYSSRDHNMTYPEYPEQEIEALGYTKSFSSE